MSDTPKKKTSKSTPAKKQAQKKPATAKGTGKPGRPKKVVAPTPDVEPKKVSESIDEFIDELQRIVEEDQPKQASDVVIHADNVKKPSLRKRMLKWFK